jgi:hypothetical protein
MLFFFVEILKQILPAIKPSDFLGQLSHLPGGALGFAFNINAKIIHFKIDFPLNENIAKYSCCYFGLVRLLLE